MIKDKNYFSSIIKTGRYEKNKYFVIYSLSNDKNRYPHFGIAIKNSIGKANVRNRLKRQMRSIVDKYKIEFKKDRDYIIMIRNECLNISFKEMDENFSRLMKGKTYEKK